MNRPAAGVAPRVYDRRFALVFLSMLGFVLANALMAHYARWVEWLGGDVRRVGWVMGAGPVIGLFLRPWVGQWINRLGARTIWATGEALFIIGVAGNLAISGLGWEIYVLRSFLVLGAALVFASGLTLVTQLAPPERRTEAIGSLGAAGFVGMLVGPALGDIILGDASRGRGEFDRLFIVTAAIVIPSWLLLALVQPHAARDRSRVRAVEFVRTVRRHWPGAILAVNPVFGMCMSVPFGFLASWVDHRRIAFDGMSGVGAFFIAYAGWGLIVRMGLRRIPDRFGRRKVLLAGLISFGSGMLCFPAVRDDAPYLLLVPAIICGMGHALAYHTMSSLTIEHFPEKVRGTGSALSLMLTDIGMIAGAPAFGVIADEFGFPVMFATISAACFAAAAFYAWRSVPIWRARAAARRSGLSSPR